MQTTNKSQPLPNSKSQTSAKRKSKLSHLPPTDQHGSDQPDGALETEGSLSVVDERVSHVEKKKKKSVEISAEEEEVDGDENTERGNWSNKFEFLLSCLGYAVGLGNVWRFPFLAFDNGGGAFFIPYFIMLFMVGMPAFFLDLCLGQFTSCGTASCWEFALIFQGIGFTMMVVTSTVAIYYNIIIAWGFYYLFRSFTDKLPWEECGDWATALCGKQDKTKFNFMNPDATCDDFGPYIYDAPKGVCRHNITNEVVAIVNKTLAKENGFKRNLASEEFFYREVLGKTEGKGWNNFGVPRWYLVLCLLLVWAWVVLTLWKGIKTSGKMVYVTAIFPYVVLIILFIRGLLLDGHEQGIGFYITPNFDKIKNVKVWKDAAVQIFFSLSAGMGGLITLSSYNPFQNDLMRDTLTVCIGNCLSSVFAGFIIFSYIGFLAKALDSDIEDVAEGGQSLAFVVYPAAVTNMPISPFWAILFFLMLITLGIDSEFVLVETVVTSLLDLFPELRKQKKLLMLSVCLVFFLLGLPMCCNGGVDLLRMADTYITGWNLMVISLCECIAISYVYGVRRFLNDIECMVGQRVCGCMPWSVWKYWWALCWCVLSPVALTLVLVFSLVNYKNTDSLPTWANVIWWCMVLTAVVLISLTMVVRLCVAPGRFSERVRLLTTPTVRWGPALPKYRELCRRYVPNFVVQPVPQTGVSPKDRRNSSIRSHESKKSSLVRTL